MSEGYVRTGKLRDGRLLELDEEVPLRDMQVKVTLEPLPSRTKHGLREVTAQIRRTQRERGHVPPTRDAVDTYIAEERATWSGRSCGSTWTLLP